MTEDRDALLELGLKEKLLSRLNAEQINQLREYALEHHSSKNLLQHVLKLASQELQGKTGACFLALRDIATTNQIQELALEQINKAREIFLDSDIDPNLCMINARKYVRDSILLNQRIKHAEITGEDLYIASLSDEGDDNNRHSYFVK